MRQQGQGGRILLMSSVTGHQAIRYLSAYGMTKAGLEMLARNLVIELSPYHITINCVAPGIIKTDFARALWEDTETLKPRLATTPMRRIGEPDEIGGIVAFLASKAASYMTGSVIVADGGVTIA